MGKCSQALQAQETLPLSPRMPSMLCLAFFSPSSSFLSASSSSSFFPNLILSTRLIELTKPQKFKGKRASISCWGKRFRGSKSPFFPCPGPWDSLLLQNNNKTYTGFNIYTYSVALQPDRPGTYLAGSKLLPNATHQMHPLPV